MPFTADGRARIHDRLGRLYPDDADAIIARLDALAKCAGDLPSSNNGELWNERTALLITYGDQVRAAGDHSLAALKQFLLDYQLDQQIDSVHLLPFCPYSSDDGFSVIDYKVIDPELGDWDDVDALGTSFRLAFDFVVNHCSQHHVWFQSYLRGEHPQVDFFHEVDPAADLSAVVRPRSLPLLTPVETNRGTRHVWTTFSADQIDLNFSSSDLLLEMLDILLLYIRHGARILRLDAIGFLWKKIGTSCMHLPETHEVVKLMRDLVDELAPGTILLTETNVPHAENISYFGEGDEAHMVYQFSLAPLLLDAFLHGDATPLTRWLSELEPPAPGMTVLNFTASHDGIGVRPLEGLVERDRFERLIEAVRQRGGRVNTRRGEDGEDKPYELNITYYSALDTVEGLPTEVHVRRFLTAQGVMLALQGVPGIYFHSLVGTPNDHEGVERTGHARSINRRKFDRVELDRLLAEEDTAPRMVLDGYRHMLAVRTAQPAFHPDAPQQVIETGEKAVIALLRTSQDGNQRILVLANVGEAPVQLALGQLTDFRPQRDLLRDRIVSDELFTLGPNEIAWLT